MANMQTIEQELREYIENAYNMNRDDKFFYLKAIFDKHFAMEKKEHLLTMADFNLIVSDAKSNYVQLALPASISNKEVYPNDAPHIAMINSIISHLNKFDVLKRFVKIDITTRTNR